MLYLNVLLAPVGRILLVVVVILEDVSINNEYKYENDYKPYSYSNSFSQLSVSDDTEFEFIENKIMGFRMTGRQI